MYFPRTLSYANKLVYVVIGTFLDDLVEVWQNLKHIIFMHIKESIIAYYYILLL